MNQAKESISMAQSHTRTLTGVTSFRDRDASTTMASVEALSVSPARVTHHIGSLGDTHPGMIVQSESIAVVRYTNQVIDARKAHEYQLTPCKPLPKPTRRRQRRLTVPSCPGCGDRHGAEDQDGNWRDCPECGG
jgi:hypothetical protein